MHTCPSCASVVIGAPEACPHCGAARRRGIVRASAAAALALALVACNGQEPQALYGVPANDADGDGYFEGEDCDDTDADVYPGATEDPSNGIDDDCDGTIDEVDA